MNTKKSSARKFLEKITGGPVTLGKLLEAVRLGDEISQASFARKLSISRSHLHDIETGLKRVSPERAARFASLLGQSEERFVALALQALVDDAGLKLTVEVKRVPAYTGRRAG